jgi:hypothetical protein
VCMVAIGSLKTTVWSKMFEVFWWLAFVGSRFTGSKGSL